MTNRTPDDANESTSVRVVEAVASDRDTDPVSLTPPLGTVVDADALDALGRSHGMNGVTISFEYAGRQVTVTEDDVIVVDPVEER